MPKNKDTAISVIRKNKQSVMIYSLILYKKIDLLLEKKLQLYVTVFRKKAHSDGNYPENVCSYSKLFQCD